MQDALIASSDRFLPLDSGWCARLFDWFPNLKPTADLSRADIILHTFFDNRWRAYPDAIAVEVSGENAPPDFNHADYAISPYRIAYGDRHLRYPFFCLRPAFHALFAPDGTLIPFDAHAEAARKERFCTIVVSNPNRDGACTALFDLLSAHKPLASGGKWRNSFGGKRVDDKLAFLRTGKFSLACENSAFPDYVTEKLIEAFAARTVPRPSSIAPSFPHWRRSWRRSGGWTRTTRPTRRCSPPPSSRTAVARRPSVRNACGISSPTSSPSPRSPPSADAARPVPG